MLRFSRTPLRVGLAIGSAATLAMSLSACAPDSDAASDDSSGIQVVASTDVYGDIAQQIGGDAIEVTSIIDDPSQDPHSYEADARVQLALSRADVVVENGGGYDDFVDTLLASVSENNAVVLNATDLSGYDTDPADGEFNEHLWYDFPTVAAVATALSDEFTSLDPQGADVFASNLTDFLAALDTLESTESTLAAGHSGTGVAITEPVPLYLLEAAGLTNETPDAFSEAIEEGTDVSPRALNDTLALFTDGTVALLVYNDQTSGAEADALLQAADDAGVPAIAVTETLPDGDDYIEWMTANLDAVETALAG